MLQVTVQHWHHHCIGMAALKEAAALGFAALVADLQISCTVDGKIGYSTIIHSSLQRQLPDFTTAIQEHCYRSCPGEIILNA